MADQNFVAPRRVTHVLPSFPTPQWWVRHGDHVIAGAIAPIDEQRVEALILLNGQPLYRSRHSSRESAERELERMHAQFDRSEPTPAI